MEGDEELIGNPDLVPLDDVLDQGGEVAAVYDDGPLQFAPQRIGRHDAEIAADIGEDGADGAAADLGGDLLGGGQAGESWIGADGTAGGRRGDGGRLGAGFSS